MHKAGITNIGVNNQAAGGNCVLNGGLGPTLLSRYKRDAITQQGVKYVMIFQGVNDIGGGGTDSGTQSNIGNQLISAFKQIAAECKAAGIKVFAATITPFGGKRAELLEPHARADAPEGQRLDLDQRHFRCCRRLRQIGGKPEHEEPAG